MSTPFTVIGFYKPEKHGEFPCGKSRWLAYEIGKDLTRLTRNLGLLPHIDPAHGPLERVAWRSEILHAEVRKRSFKTKMAEGWHYDGDTTPGSKPDCGIVLWASNHPTQVTWRGVDDHSVYQPKPYEVILFRNLECLHRRPPGVPHIRWVFRQRVAVPKGFKL